MSDLDGYITKRVAIKQIWDVKITPDAEIFTAVKTAQQSLIEQLPSADVAEVVRCRECKWWREDSDHTCGLHFGASPLLAIDYCSRGEPKE